MGKSSQRKGRAGELELARLLEEYGAKPGLPVNHGTTPDIVGLSGIHVEVKRVEHLNVNEAMNQSIRDSEKFSDGIPTLFHRKNRQPWLVTMRLEDWISLYRKWADNEP